MSIGAESLLPLARLRNERQALAMMDHSNIAQILDAGAATFSNEAESWGGATADQMAWESYRIAIARFIQPFLLGFPRISAEVVFTGCRCRRADRLRSGCVRANRTLESAQDQTLRAQARRITGPQ